MDNCSLSPHSIELPTGAGHIKYVDTQSSHNRLQLQSKSQGSLLWPNIGACLKLNLKENLDLTQNKTQSESAGVERSSQFSVSL